MRVLHYVHELTIGGGSVHVHQILKDTKALGHEGACATLQSGPVANWMREDGIPVFHMTSQEDLMEIAKGWGADVLHGHTCGGGSYACKVARELGIVGGETIHSMVGGENPEADFEVVELDCLQRMRPKSTKIRWAYNPERFRLSHQCFCLGYKHPREEMKRSFGIPEEAVVIGRNGRLDGSKAPDEFIRCLAKLPDCWGLLGGEGPEKDNLRSLAQSLGCSDRLVMPGHYERPGDLFVAMDIVVYPTRDESVCAGVHEPLFVRRPVVCYPVGGMSETIIHRKTGLHAHNVDELVHWVNYLTTNPRVAEDLGEAGYKQLVRNGQTDPVGEAQLHLDLYQKLLK